MRDLYRKCSVLPSDIPYTRSPGLVVTKSTPTGSPRSFPSPPGAGVARIHADLPALARLIRTSVTDEDVDAVLRHVEERGQPVTIRLDRVGNRLVGKSHFGRGGLEPLLPVPYPGTPLFTWTLVAVAVLGGLGLLLRWRVS